MKKYLPTIVLSLLLCACAQGGAEKAVWQDTLPQSGVELSVSGCELTVGYTWYAPPDGDAPVSVLLLCADDAPLLTLDENADMQIAFASPYEDRYGLYTMTTPIEKVDYVPLSEKTGQKNFRFDTAYCFVVSISTEQGTDTLILDCRRDV